MRWPLLAALAFALVFPTFITLLYFVWLAKAPTGLQQSAYAAGKVAQFAFPLIFALLVERWRPRRPHLAAQPRGVIAGIIIGLLQFASILAVYSLYLKSRPEVGVLTEEVRRKVTGLGVAGPGSFVVLSLFYCVVHSLLEEYYWRWFVYGRLRRVCSELPANVISSLGFMAHHVVVLATYLGWNSPLVWAGSLAVAVAGSVWAWHYERSSLWGPWIAHVLADAAIFVIGYHLLFPAQ